MQQAQKTKFRVLIGDTSVRSRMVLSGMIDAEPNLEVVDTAQTKEELLYKAFASRPDIIVTHTGLTSSGNMPAFKPVYWADAALLLMVSQEMSALSNPLNRHMKVVKPEQDKVVKDKNAVFRLAASGLLLKLKELVQKHTSLSYQFPLNKPTVSDFFTRPQSSLPSPDVDNHSSLCVVAVGASTGGSTAIEYLIRDLQVSKPTVVLVAVHMPEKFTKLLAKRLQKATNWQVVEGYQGMELKAGTVVIAPGGTNTRVQKRPFYPYQLFLELELATALDTPSVDILFESVADCVKHNALGIILTGMGSDGTAGAVEIRKNGGVVIAQDRETSSIFGMAKSAIDSGAVSGVFALGQINSIIQRFVEDRNQSQLLQTYVAG